MPTKQQKSKKVTQKQIVTAAAKRHKVPPWLLWGIYGAESTYGTNGTNYFGLIEGSYNGRSVHSTSNLIEDSDIAAELLASLKKEHGSWPAAVSAYSGGEYDISHPRQLSSGGKEQGTQFVDFGPQTLLPGGLGKSLLEGLGVHIPSPEGIFKEGAENVIGTDANFLGLGGITSFFQEASKLLFTPEGWLQIGEISAGVILIGWGLHHIVNTATGVNPTQTVTKTATKAAEIAAVVK